MSTARAFRYYVRSPDGKAIFGFDMEKAAEMTALEYGDGAFVIDTVAKNYDPMVSEVIGGELLIAGISGWATGRPGGLDEDFVESVKKGHIAIPHAFLAKGADVNAKDVHGSPALHWAVGGGHAEIVRILLESGADISATDANGMLAIDVARKRNLPEIITLLEAA